MADKKTNFILLIGGPGKFAACDRAHDQTWKNYIVPIQPATQEKLLAADKGENIHWWVYGPAYKERWEDDLAYTTAKKPPKPGENLLDSRKKALDAIKKTGAIDYLDRIKKIAESLGVTIKILEKPDDFWDSLAKFPDQSVSRIWYIGHASATGLMLKLIHNENCRPVANTGDMILKDTILKKKPDIGIKLIIDPSKISRFYGCYTCEFAKQWHDVFSVSTEGAIHKIDFGVIDKPSETSNVLKRLEGSNPNTDWTAYPAGR